MRFLPLIFLVAVVVATCGVVSAGNPAKHDCVSFSEAGKHVGTTQCVSGTVFRVQDAGNGVTLLNFCNEAGACPFTVAVFPADLKKMGDIRQLEGRQIEIKGTIEDYDGRTQMVLRRTQQLGESAFAMVPAVPTDYDVERRGHYSPGRFKRPKAGKKTPRKQGAPVTIEDPAEP